MFKLLSKESNIFSIPVYIGFLLLLVIYFNFLYFNTLDAISAVIFFAGIALGYFCFNAIALNHQIHLPLFLYTFLIFSFYGGKINIGLSTALLTNSFIILIVTNTNSDIRKKSYVMVGAILALNYLFLPITWPTIVFVLLQIIVTSDRILLHIFRLLFGAFLIVLCYFGFAYANNSLEWDRLYFPFEDLKPVSHYKKLLFLSPIAIMLIVAIFDHFANYNKKSPISKFKYSFLLLYLLAQLVTIILYMGNHYEYLLLLALPTSIILSRFLYYADQYWKKELGLWLIIICLIIFKIANYF